MLFVGAFRLFLLILFILTLSSFREDRPLHFWFDWHRAFWLVLLRRRSLSLLDSLLSQLSHPLLPRFLEPLLIGITTLLRQNRRFTTIALVRVLRLDVRLRLIQHQLVAVVLVSSLFLRLLQLLGLITLAFLHIRIIRFLFAFLVLGVKLLVAVKLLNEMQSRLSLNYFGGRISCGIRADDLLLDLRRGLILLVTTV